MRAGVGTVQLCRSKQHLMRVETLELDRSCTTFANRYLHRQPGNCISPSWLCGSICLPVCPCGFRPVGFVHSSSSIHMCTWGVFVLLEIHNDLHLHVRQCDSPDQVKCNWSKPCLHAPLNYPQTLPGRACADLQKNVCS